MIDEVAANIFRIGVPLPDNPLKELNSYLIRGEHENLLIDTGFRCKPCYDALAEAFRELGVSVEETDVLNTHMHADHTGLSRHFAGSRRHIYLSKTDLSVLESNLSGADFRARDIRYRHEGFPPDMLEKSQEGNPTIQYMVTGIDERFTGLDPGTKFRTGGYQLELLAMPGHSPGNLMFWCEAEQIMFTGDHILFDISPNITAWTHVEDSLGDYLDSLHAAKRYPVKTALPAHRKSGDYHQRIDALLEHHEKRLAETLAIVRAEPGLTAYEIAGRMQWKIRSRNWAEFPLVQKWFAVGECMAHLDYLRIRKKIVRDESGALWKYESNQSLT